MLQSVLNYQARTNRELKEIVEERVISIKRFHEEAREDTLRPEVDLVLKEKKTDWMCQLLELVRNERFQGAKVLDTGLIVLENICLIDEEQVEETSLLSKVSSLNELEEIYHKTVFYLCRMEFGMADENCEVFLDLMELWKFSVSYMIMVLEKSSIFRRADVGYRLGEILLKNGYQDYGEKIIMWVKAQIENLARGR